LKLNTKNRNAAIKASHIKYGPLNIDEPGDYWEKIADHWDTTEAAAKKSLCGNCVAFDISPRMDECMPGETSDDDGRLGYCWMHHFKCHSARSCYTWAKGGPIKADKKSLDWQERNKDSVKKSYIIKATPPTNKPPENGGVNPQTGTADKPPAGYTGFGSKRGGFRKPKAGGGYDYWYPGTGHSKDHHPKDAKHVEKLRRAEMFFEKVKQKVENGEYEGEELERAKKILAEYERKVKRREIQDKNPTQESKPEIVDEKAERIELPEDKRAEEKKKLPKTASKTHIILSSMGLTLDTPGIVTDRGLLIAAVSTMGTLVFGRSKWVRDGDKWYPKNNKFLKFSNAELVEHLMKTMSPKEIAESIRDRGKRKEERRKRRQEEAGAPVQEEISRDTQLGQMGI